MNADELVTTVRYSAYIKDSHPEYTNARIRIELWNCLANLFGDRVLKSRSGYWRQHQLITLTAGKRAYRLPERALAKAVDLVEVLDGTQYRKLTELDQREAGGLEGETGDPVYYEVGADYLYLHPTPSAAGTMRIKFPLRPPKLVQAQTKGLIAAVNVAGHIVNATDIPDAYASGSAVPIADYDPVDVVNPNGWSELALFSEPQLGPISTTFFTTVTTADMYRVQVGDYMRAADESEFPMLPEEFHHTLADAAAANILLHMRDGTKAQTLAAKVTGELDRFQEQIQPRFKYSPRPLRRRRSRGMRWPIAPG